MDGYELNNDLWDRDTAISGSQCTFLDSYYDGGIQWHTVWIWPRSENDIKSYAYSGKQFSRGQKIFSIGSMGTSVQWDNDSNVIRANATYDIFTATEPIHVTSNGDYETCLNFACIIQWPFQSL
jgi:Glycosyl hydrolase family 12.